MRRSFRLPDACTVFQGEIFAIKMACDSMLKLHEDKLMSLHMDSKVAVCVDSQAAIKALGSVYTSSTLVKECKGLLNVLGNKCDLTILWVPGHSLIQGNEDADLLARQGADLHISWKVKTPTPVAFYREMIRDTLVSSCKARWLRSKYMANNIWECFNTKRSRELLDKSRNYIRKIVFLTTGHWNIGRHARRLGIDSSKEYPGCGLCAQDTDIEHVWCLCPGLVRARLKHLGSYSFSSLTEINAIPFGSKLAFMNAVEWI